MGDLSGLEGCSAAGGSAALPPALTAVLPPYRLGSPGPAPLPAALPCAGWNKLTVSLWTHARNGLTGEVLPADFQSVAWQLRCSDNDTASECGSGCW